jgi:hypothetical protein
MARIRTIKPQICTSRVVARMTLEAQFLWERMWLFCDDEGRLDYHPDILKGEAFPLVKQMTADVIDKCVKEMAEQQLITVYDIGERTYIEVRNWHEHQKIKNPTASKLPPPPAITPNQGSPTPERGKPTGNQGSPTPLEVGIRNKEVGKKEPPIGGSKENRKRFSAPTPAEVDAYCSEEGYGVDGERFCAFYASKGWVVGKSPMRDWKAAVRGWASRDKAKASPALGFQEATDDDFRTDRKEAP